MGELVKYEPAAPVGDQLQYLTFSLGGEMFAVGILRVKEIIEYGNVTVVPMMPECIHGVINLRGAVVPVVDLARRFSANSTKLTRRSCIIIVEIDDPSCEAAQAQDIGVIVDAVSEVLEIPSDQIEPAPAFGAQLRTDFIAGMGKVNERFVIILNLDRVLSLEDLALAPTPGGETEIVPMIAGAA